MWRITLSIEILWLLIQSLRIRMSKVKNGVSLPPVATDHAITRQDADRIVDWFDTLVSTFMWHNQHVCFYRSHGLATILRKRGIAVVMNVGGRGLGIDEAKKAHCWLSLDDQLFHEKENALQLYPFDMGYNRSQSIRYWIGPELNDELLNGNQVARTRTVKPLFKRFKGP